MRLRRLWGRGASARDVPPIERARHYAATNGWAVSAELEATVSMIYHGSPASEQSFAQPATGAIAIVSPGPRMIVAYQAGLGFLEPPLTVKPTLRPDGHSWEISTSATTLILRDINRRQADSVFQALANW